MSGTEIKLALQPDDEAPSTARNSLSRLRDFLAAEQLESLRLVVTELVTNSVVHVSCDPEETIGLWVALLDDSAVRVEVTDCGSGFEKPTFDRGLPSETVRSGWGLYLVESVSRSWGVSTEPSRVWCEVPGKAG